MLQVQVARCLWRLERGSCWSCTRHLLLSQCRVLSATGASRQVCVATRKRFMLELRHAIINLIIKCVLYTTGASRQVCVATRKRFMLELRHAIINLIIECVLYTTGASRQVCVATRKRFMLELRHAIINLIIAVCAVCCRCKSPGVCGVPKEVHAGVGTCHNQSYHCSVCCLLQVQVARCVWRSERGSCWSCDMPARLLPLSSPFLQPPRCCTGYSSAAMTVLLTIVVIITKSLLFCTVARPNALQS